MATDFIKRIQSRLSSVGIRLSKSQLQAEIELLGITEINDDNCVSIFETIKQAQSKITTAQTEQTKISTLTPVQKQSLTQIQSQQLGIELSQVEIVQISEAVNNEVVDSIDYLSQVAIVIREFIERRNSQVQNTVSQKVNDIATIINTGNDELGDIFNSANHRLSGIVGDCKRRNTDYKSTTTDKIKNLRKALSLPE